MRNAIIILLVIALVGGFIYTLNRHDKKESATPPISSTDLKALIEQQQTDEAKKTEESVRVGEKVNVENNTQINKLNSSKVMTIEEKLKMPPPTRLEVNKDKEYTAVLKTTAGDITVVLDVKNVPMTVNNFVYLAKNNFYNNTVFHRVIKGFMIQGGDPRGDGTGGPAYRFADETFSGEYLRGTIAMANAGPNTNGSQFFIMHDDYPLPPNYTIFGHVVTGLEVVDKIATAPVRPGGEGSTPVSPVEVKEVDVIEK